MVNHFEFHSLLSSKDKLFENMCIYCDVNIFIFYNKFLEKIIRCIWLYSIKFSNLPWWRNAVWEFKILSYLFHENLIKNSLNTINTPGFWNLRTIS